MTIKDDVMHEIEAVEQFVADTAHKIEEAITGAEKVAVDFTKMDPASLIDMGIQLLTALKGFFPVPIPTATQPVTPESTTSESR